MDKNTVSRICFVIRLFFDNSCSIAKRTDIVPQVIDSVIDAG